MAAPNNRRYAHATDPASLDSKTRAALVTLREEKNLSVEQLAETAGISADLLRGIECGQVETTIEVLRRIVKPLGKIIERFTADNLAWLERDPEEYWREVREAGPEFWVNLPRTKLSVGSSQKARPLSERLADAAMPLGDEDATDAEDSPEVDDAED